MIRSLFYSLTFHTLLIFITILSLPFMLREPIDLPPIVSVELIQITDKTSIPYAPKARKIIEETNIKLNSKNEILANEINQKNSEIFKFKDKISSQAETIAQFNLANEELEFLKMNLYYGHKCRRSFINVKGFTVGTEEYKRCVLRKGRKD